MKLLLRTRSLMAVPFLLAVGLAHGQQVIPCATDQVQQRLIEQNPDLVRQNAEYQLGLQEYLQAKAGLRDDGDNVVYVIPIVFHILYDPTAGNDNHNLSNSVIEAQVAQLNKDYRKLNADTANVVDPFKPINADIRVEFQLATKDPFGNCTNGIDRITSQRSTQAADFSKLNPWFRDRYVNIWVIRALEQNTPGSTTLGYSQLPAYVQDDFGALRDGVIMLSSEIGTTSTTLTHELGHFLNLEHVWGSTNQPGVACGDDNVADTPITKGHFSFCDLNDHECNSWNINQAYTFDEVNTGSGTIDPTTPPSGLFQDSLPGLNYSSFKANGVSPNPAEDDRFSFTQWDSGATDGDSLYSQMTGSLSTSKYYEFTVQPSFGQSMTISGMTFDIARSATGPRTFAVRSSTSNNFSANNSASLLGPDSIIKLPIPNTFFFSADTIGQWGGNKVTFTSYTSIRNAVTIRIYAWNAEDSDGSFAVDNVRLIGTFGEVDNAQNYMDYSSCPLMFT
ncbi:MAG: M43 family zinc metalloprotease, partial [Flavobacteriales bacterium]